MIYLLQDCYKDPNGEYHDILKIGYSSRSFLEGRKPHYDTHNFGYTFLGEKEGSVELESYLHYRFKDYQISTEWFRYDQEIIDVFNEISEDDDLPFTSDKEIIKYSRKYILDNLIPSVSKLSDLFLKKLLSEVKRESEKFSDFVYLYENGDAESFDSCVKQIEEKNMNAKNTKEKCKIFVENNTWNKRASDILL